MKSRWLPVLIVLAGMLPSAWLLLKFRDTPQLGFLMDDVMYIGAAQSLATTGTYRQPVLPGDPWQTKYPPGYPLLLAAILKLQPAARDFWIIAQSWIWLLLSAIALAWAMTESGLSRIQAATVAAIWASNPTASLVGTSAMSEVPFCAFLFLAVGFAQRAKRGNRVAMAAAAGILTGLASVIRTAGIFALPAVVLWLLWNKRWRAAFCFAICAAVLPALWIAWSRAHLPTTHDYITDFYFNYSAAWLYTLKTAGLRTMIPRNLVFSVMAIGGWFIASYSRMFLAVLRDVVLSVGAGLAMLEWDGGAFTAIWLVTVAVQVVYFFPADGRFYIAAAPATLAAVVVSLTPRAVWWKALALAAVVAANIYGTAELASDYSTKRELRAEFAPVDAFLTSQTPAGSVILTSDVHLWLRTGRPVISMPLPPEYFYIDQDDVAVDRFFLTYKRVALDYGARYLVLSPLGMGSELTSSGPRERFFRSVHSDPSLQRVFASNGIEVFRIAY
jgi:hypothetical protein